MKKRIAVLSGDGIGPEVMEEALKVLSAVGEKYGVDFEYDEALIGGAAYEKYYEHFPAETKGICESADAILFGSVGGPVNRHSEEKWRNCETNSILALRKHFGFSVNLRPVKVFSALKNINVLKEEIVNKGIDLMCVRELSGGIYFGEHTISGEKGKRVARDVLEYDEEMIRFAARSAFEVAMKRRKRLHSVDKANVLHSSKLWREVVDEVAKDFPECEYQHILVDNCAMQIVSRPYDFDVILAENMFGDILSDEAAVLAGSLGLLPSASFNREGFGLYEPSGGSAPDIAGMGIANPIAQILSAAMMLKYSFEMDQAYQDIYDAVEKVLDEGYRTVDITGGGTSVSTDVMGDVIAKYISNF